MKHLEKLVGEGVITVDGDGVIRLTETAWTTMTTFPPVPEPVVVNHEQRHRNKHRQRQRNRHGQA